jgi:dipeptidyl aminopeptidase/acylaminoacyl peptidase
LNDTEFLDRLLALPAQFHPIVSRDGRRVAFARRGFGHGTQVYLATLEADAAAHRLTAPPGDSFPVSWGFDGASLIVSRSHDGDERDSLFLIDIGSGRETRLTRRPDDHFISGGALHPNGRWLFYGATKDFVADRPVESAWLWRHDIETNERLCLARPSGGNRTSPQVSPTGDAVLYQRNDRDPGGRQLWLVSVDGADDREIVNAGDGVQASGAWSPDASAIAVHANGPGHSRVGIWQRTDGGVRWLIDDARRNVEQAFWPAGSGRIACIETMDAVSRGFLLDPATGRETPIRGQKGETLLPIAPAASGHWLGRRFDAQHPDGFVLFDPANAPHELRAVAPLPEEVRVAPELLAAPRGVSWVSTDGATVQGWLYQPRRKPIGAVVAVHGGPTWHIENRLSALVQYLVHRGFAVLEPNYRGSTGFGPDWRDAIKEDGWGGREQDDIRTGIRMLIETGIARRGCVGITGLSYGGYSSWCAITRWPVDEVAAAAPVCGMTDLVVDYETTRPDLRAYSIEMMGGTPAQIPEKYRARSPINFVGNIRGELLIVQGMQDPNVTPENLAAVRKALDRAGVRYEVLAFDDEGHGIAKAANRRVLYARLADFFERAFARTMVAG